MSRLQNGNASNMASRVNHRITVLGDGGVGKTALVVQFTMSQFVETYDPTIEDCYRRLWVVDDQACLLEVLDTAGQEEYTALRNQWIKDGEGFILVYSIASSASFSRIPDIFDRVLDTKRMQGEDRPPIIIVGNKCDRGQTDREVSVDSGRQQAFDLGADAFFEVRSPS
ncbi:small GTPase superfamily [Mrakia frigida]|uniref:small GTPase superfamily n=1 Tax=Mrakia frigida TaxID=29902 RepID=UPI003FCC1586